MFRILPVIFIFISFRVWSQSGSGSQVLSRMEKKKWVKAEQLIAKTLAKNSSDAEIKYTASLLFFNKDYPRYNLDSAYRYAMASINDYTQLDIRDKEKLKKFPIDSVLLYDHKRRIDNAAFGFAKSVHTEEAYHYFIIHHPTASQVSAAIELRDEVAFLEALKINTYSSFDVFLRKYPSSHRSADARKRYDKLLYEDRTRDERLKSYENFVREFPSSPYGDMAEQQILQITTADGSTDSFLHFIKRYPGSKWVSVAQNILFHLDHDAGHALKEDMTDSLRSVEELDRLYWVPFLKGDRYGFMDAEGKERIAASFDAVSEEYQCGNIRADYLVTSQGVISRSGKVLFHGEVKEVDDLGDGFLKVTTAPSILIVHKSGTVFRIDGLKDADVVAGRFIAVRKESGWGIVSFTGRILLPYVYETISSLDNWVILGKNGKKILVTATKVGEVANKIPLSESLVFDEVRRWSERLCWVKNGALEGVLNENLEFVIPFERQTLTKASFGFLRTKNDQQFVEGIAELQNKSYRQVTVQGQWIATKESSGALQLVDISSGKKIVQQADSIWFEKNIAMVKQRDSVRAWLNKRIHLDFNLSEKTTLFGKDSAAWLVVAERNKKTVYNALSGQRLFTGDFDQIENLSEGLFLLTKANKKGIVDSRGKTLLPTEYDAIIQSEPERLSLLKEKKFGLYDMQSKKLIRPAYDRNLVPYNRYWFAAYKEGAWGFIDTDAKPVGKFQFNEIQFWNDSSAWVKENFQWKIYDIQGGKVLQDKIKDFHYVKKYPHEYVAIIHQDNYYGVISNRSGVVIPSAFTDIVNIGDADKPMYFTEKHVEEADISVVIYYSHNGKVLRRQAFESADEYERIYCGKK